MALTLALSQQERGLEGIHISYQTSIRLMRTGTTNDENGRVRRGRSPSYRGPWGSVPQKLFSGRWAGIVNLGAAEETARRELIFSGIPHVGCHRHHHR